MKTGVELISEERERQAIEYGFIPSGENYTENELLDAALLYLNKAIFGEVNVDSNWPFVQKYYSEADYMTCLKRAGALIATELDRIQTN